MTITDYNEAKTFHPSLDIKDDTLVLGFRRKKEDGKEEDIYLIKTDRYLTTTEKVDFYDDDNNLICIDKKKRLLAKLSQKWGVDNLNKLFENPPSTDNIQVSGIEIYNKIKDNLRKYIELENEADYIILPAWIMGTYYFPSFSAFPYIHIKAPKASGKSQCLNFILQTAFNAIKARASLPALRDTVDSMRGTYIMDQADSLHRNNMEDFLDVLTDSYKRGGGGIRKMIATKNAWNVEEFDAYGPKAFGSISQLPEDLRDRCIVTPLIRSKKNHPQIEEEDTLWKEIRGDLYLFLIDNFQYVSTVYKFKIRQYRENKGVLGRQLELWLPIETVLSVVGVSEEDLEIAKKRFLSRYEFASYQASDIEGAVINTIIFLMKEDEEKMLRPKDIVEEIDSDLFDEEKELMGKKQKASIVGRAINKFNLAIKKLNRDGQGERYLFNKTHLLKIHNSYFAENEEKDTQTYIEENTLITKDILSETSDVS